MLERALRHPSRIYVFIGVLAAIGIWCGLKLPISLYPQTSKPVVSLYVGYGGYSSEEFIRKYGAQIEYQLENIKNTGLALESVKSNYSATSVDYTITYDWKVPFANALKEVQAVAASAKGFLPRESGDDMGVSQWNENAGFLAISFYSSRHTLNDLYNLLDPVISPELKKITDAEEAVLWNPESQEVGVHLIPEKMALYGLLPGAVHRSIDTSLSSLTGGEVRLGQDSASFQIPTPLKSGVNLENHIIDLAGKRRVHLKDIADISVGRSDERSNAFKTDGKESLILFASPKSGANVKRMAEDILALVKKQEKLFPDGVQYRVLVDPSEFIRGSVQNLVKDIIFAALLTVLVLFLFIGNLRNVVTVALEIPLSMVLAFIVMYATGMNLNLISLGGLALAAGMNVDASVVVLENIFRHQARWSQQNTGPQSASDRFLMILNAVREVAGPIFVSTATTLIVFIPLAMTTDLTNAILGDLAKAVIYSHAVSAFVAVFLVPSIRLTLMKHSGNKPVGVAPLEKQMRWLEKNYIRLVQQVLGRKTIKLAAYTVPVVIAGLLALLIVPKLPKEIVGTPDTDWIFMSVTAPQSSAPRQMENILQEVESKALKTERDYVDYTFVQMQSKNNGSVMLRLKDKADMKGCVERLQKAMSNTPELFFYVDAWNPAELPLPHMNHLEVRVSGKNNEDIRQTISRIKYFVNEQGDYKRLSTKPSAPNSKIHQFIPYEHVWSNLEADGNSLNLMDVLQLTVYANRGKSPGSMLIDGKMTPINMKFADHRYQNPDLLAAYPLKIAGKVVPLSALGHFKTVEAPTEIFRQDGREVGILSSTLDKSEEDNWEALSATYRDLLAKNQKELTAGKDVALEFMPAKKELFEALAQVRTSLIISLLLIVLVLWLQFQSLRQVLIILMTIPVGLIGAFVALYAMGSTLSLNSALGVILLNGIAVTNAILLVEVYNHMLSKGVPSREAVLEACRSRLRPILITALTTVLGMLPIAMGWGDGGKILQPLGIVVGYGLLFSTAISLFIVPIALYRTEAPIDQEHPLPELADDHVPPKEKAPEELVWQ
jgi:HAE1 family hydrophobic/amphiphilic exporter-1